MVSPAEKHEADVDEKLEAGRATPPEFAHAWVVRTKYRIMGDVPTDVPGEGLSREKLICVGKFVVPPTATAQISKGMTIELGDREFARITAGFTCQCYAEEMREVSGVIGDILDEIVRGEVADIKGWVEDRRRNKWRQT